IYIIGAGTIGKALAVILQRHGREVVLVRASEVVPASVQRIEVMLIDGALISEELAVLPLQDIVRFDGTVVVATKSYGNDGLAAVLKDKVGGAPVVIMQNGLGVEDAFLGVGLSSVFRCVLFATSQYGDHGKVVFKPVTASQVGVVAGSPEVLGEAVAAI